MEYEQWNQPKVTPEPAANQSSTADTDAAGTSATTGLGAVEYLEAMELLHESQLGAEYFNRLLQWSLGGIVKTAEAPMYYAEIVGALRETDFYTAPASTRYHEAYSGGLCEHSLKVVKRMTQLLRSGVWNTGMEFVKQAVFCALVHDFTKIGQYESFSRNVKNEVTGKWDAVQSWRYRKDRVNLMGHGEGSVHWCTKLRLPLTYEMTLAIRWHMGLWDCSTSAQADFGEACRKYPLVHLVQFSDLLSTSEY